MECSSLLTKHFTKAWLALEQTSLKCILFLQDEKKFAASVLMCVILLFAIATITCNHVSYPIIFFGSITAIFAFQSYKFTKEKFRLDLRQQRIPTFNALKKLMESTQGVGIFLLPEEDQMPMDQWYFRLNTEKIENTSSQMEFIKNKLGEPNGLPLIEDIRMLYGADVKSAIQDINAALFTLEHSWPKSPDAYVAAETIKTDINPALKKLNESGQTLYKSLEKYMEFGEYSK